MSTHEHNGYTLENRAKAEAAAIAVERTRQEGDETTLLAEYDKRGGLIKLDDGFIVPRGTFWDFENNCPRKKPLSLPKTPKKTLLGKAKAAVKKVVKRVRGKN